MHLLNGTFPLPAVRGPLHFLHQQSMVFSNATGLARNEDLIASSERSSGQALLGQLRRRGPFDNPDLHLAFFVWGLHPNEGMRIAPYELFYCSFDLYGFAMDVNRGRGVMSEGVTAAQRQKCHNAQ